MTENLKLVQLLLRAAIQSGQKFEIVEQSCIDCEVRLQIEGHLLRYHFWYYRDRREYETFAIDGEPVRLNDSTRNIISSVGVYTDEQTRKQLFGK